MTFAADLEAEINHAANGAGLRATDAAFLSGTSPAAVRR